MKDRGKKWWLELSPFPTMFYALSKEKPYHLSYISAFTTQQAFSLDKIKRYTDDKWSVAENIKFVFHVTSISPFPTVFKRHIHQGHPTLLCGKSLTLSQTSPCKNRVGKGENASHKHFLLFQNCFLGPVTRKCNQQSPDHKQQNPIFLFVSSCDLLDKYSTYYFEIL